MYGQAWERGQCACVEEESSLLSAYRKIGPTKYVGSLALAVGFFVLAVVIHELLTEGPTGPANPVDSTAESESSGLHALGEDPALNAAAPGKRLPEVPDRNPDADGEAAADQADKEDDIEFAMPDWARIFNADGSLKDQLDRKGKSGPNGISDFVDLYHGVSARFTREILSNGVATDMTALLDDETLSNQILYNGPVSPAHDLGNTWSMTSRSAAGGLRLFTAVERLTRGQSTHIEFEFNQLPVRLGSGTPWWRLQGERADDDLLVTMNFHAGKLDSVEVAFWDGAGFEPIQTLPGLSRQGCIERSFIIYCIGPPQIELPSGEGFEVWDEDFVILESTEPEQLVELALEVNEIYAKHVEFGGLIVRTPEDLAIDWFSGGARRVASIFGSSHEDRGGQ